MGRGLLNFLCLTLWLASSNSFAVDTESQFRKIQAAWIYNIARFIEFPLQQSTSQLDICISGQDAEKIAKELAIGVAGRTIQNLPIQVRHIKEPVFLNCHLVYQTLGFEWQIEQMQQTSQVWISAPGHQQHAHSLFSLKLVGNKLELYLNKTVLQQSQLNINPSLLRLAKPMEVSQ